MREVRIDRSAPRRNWRLAGVVVFAIAGFLLLSVGGAAVLAAPVTVPLMLAVSRRRPTTTFRVAGVVLVGLTVAEVVWALTVNGFVPSACGESFDPTVPGYQREAQDLLAVVGPMA